MIDTKTTCVNLKKLFHTNKHFYCRISMAKYLEDDIEGQNLPWNWMAKVGTKDNSFAIRLTGFGVKEPKYVLERKYKPVTCNKLYQILNSYAEYLDTKMHPLVMVLNQKKIHF